METLAVQRGDPALRAKVTAPQRGRDEERVQKVLAAFLERRA